MSALTESGRARARLAWAALLLVCAVLSVLWWRADLASCTCHACADGHCGYAERIHSALAGRAPGAWPNLLRFAQWYLHAQIPLSASLVAVAMFAGLSARWSFVVVSAAATLLTWLVVQRTVAASRPDRTTLALVGVAFWTGTVVVRGFARPVTDAVGMACCAASLWAILAHVERRSAASGARLFAFQLMGLLSRVAFIPMLAMPALAELLRAGEMRERVHRALRAGLLFGVLPGVLVRAATVGLGIDHTASIWSWAHAPQFVSNDRPGDLLAGLWASGSVYLAIGVAGLLRGDARDLTRLVHLAWTVLYVAFLVLGGGALWPRYFAPVVPSIVVLAAPGIAALVRHNSALACAIVAVAALASTSAVVAGIGGPAAVLDRAGAEIRSSGVRPRDGQPTLPVLRGKMVPSASDHAEAAGAMTDGDRASRWRTAGPQREGAWVRIDLPGPRRVVSLRLDGDWNEGPRSFVVEGSNDGTVWEPLADSGELRERASLQSLVVTLPGAAVRSLRIRLTASADAPWSIREVQVLVAAPRRTVSAPEGAGDPTPSPRAGLHRAIRCRSTAAWTGAA